MPLELSNTFCHTCDGGEAQAAGIVLIPCWLAGGDALEQATARHPAVAAAGRFGEWPACALADALRGPAPDSWIFANAVAFTEERKLARKATAYEQEKAEAAPSRIDFAGCTSRASVARLEAYWWSR